MKLDQWFLQAIPAVLAALLLPACSSVSNSISNVTLWPFSGPVERPIAPPNGTEYKCAGGKTFYMRYMDNNASAWVILPDREVRLDKQGATARYTNGATALTVDAGTIALTDGAANAYSGCKAATAVTGSKDAADAKGTPEIK